MILGQAGLVAVPWSASWEQCCWREERACEFRPSCWCCYLSQGRF